MQQIALKTLVKLFDPLILYGRGHFMEVYFSDFGKIWVSHIGFVLAFVSDRPETLPDFKAPQGDEGEGGERK
jgi:hypothetical protein